MANKLTPEVEDTYKEAIKLMTKNDWGYTRVARELGCSISGLHRYCYINGNAPKKLQVRNTQRQSRWLKPRRKPSAGSEEILKGVFK